VVELVLGRVIGLFQCVPMLADANIISRILNYFFGIELQFLIVEERTKHSRVSRFAILQFIN